MEMNWVDSACSFELVHEANGPGNLVFAEVERGGVTELFTRFGERGVPAEKVVGNVVRKVRRYCKADAPVGEYWAGQRLLPLAIGAPLRTGGGEFRTLDLSEHAHSHSEILRKFANVDLQVKTLGPDDVRMRVLRCKV